MTQMFRSRPKPLQIRNFAFKSGPEPAHIRNSMFKSAERARPQLCVPILLQVSARRALWFFSRRYTADPRSPTSWHPVDIQLTWSIIHFPRRPPNDPIRGTKRRFVQLPHDSTHDAHLRFFCTLAQIPDINHRIDCYCTHDGTENQCLVWTLLRMDTDTLANMYPVPWGASWYTLEEPKDTFVSNIHFSCGASSTPETC